MLATVHVHLLAAAVTLASPSPTPSPAISGGRVGPFIPVDTAPNTNAAGGLAFLIVMALIAVSALLFWAMSHSLRRARQNLGGEIIPGRGFGTPTEGPGPVAPGSGGA